MPADSRIEIQLIDFVELSEPGSPPIIMDLKGKTGGGGGQATDGTVTTTGNYHVKLDHRTVGAPTYDVKFWITLHALNPDRGADYRIIGVSFRNRDMSNPVQTVGQHVVKKIQIQDEKPDTSKPTVTQRTLTVTIDTRALPAGSDETLEFCLIVQRTSDAALGLIDPEWENEN